MDCVADITHLEITIGKCTITSIEEGIHKWHAYENGLEDQ